jgi:branched-chain amino acid transport system ATP-binding protein
VASDRPILQLAAVSKRFGSVVVADGIDLNVAPGEALGVLGPNGAGKSTLFHLITGTLPANAGDIRLDGRSIAGLSPEARCRLGIARSFQVPQPFGGMTVFENLLVAACFGRGVAERAAERHCAEILDRCGLIDKANRRAGSLTLLDRKRLELARALATKPRLLLLDEVAGGLTEHECHALVELIRAVHAEGATIIWIEHVVHALLAVVGRIVVLHGGRFIADGPPQEVIRSPQVAEIYMGIDADG